MAETQRCVSIVHMPVMRHFMNQGRHSHCFRNICIQFEGCKCGQAKCGWERRDDKWCACLQKKAKAAEWDSTAGVTSSGSDSGSGGSYGKQACR